MNKPTTQTVQQTREAFKQKYGADLIADYSDEQVLTVYEKIKALAESNPDFERLLPSMRALARDWSNGPTDPRERINWVYRTSRRRQGWQDLKAFIIEMFWGLVVLGFLFGPLFVGTVPIEGDSIFDLVGRLIGRWLSAWPVIFSAIKDHIFAWLGFA